MGLRAGCLAALGPTRITSRLPLWDLGALGRRALLHGCRALALRAGGLAALGPTRFTLRLPLWDLGALGRRGRWASGPGGLAALGPTRFTLRPPLWDLGAFGRVDLRDRATRWRRAGWSGRPGANSDQVETALVGPRGHGSGGIIDSTTLFGRAWGSRTTNPPLCDLGAGAPGLPTWTIWDLGPGGRGSGGARIVDGMSTVPHSGDLPCVSSASSLLLPPPPPLPG